MRPSVYFIHAYLKIYIPVLCIPTDLFTTLELSSFLDYIKFADLTMLPLSNSERASRDVLRDDPFTFFEPRNPPIDVFYVLQKRGTTDFKTQKL